MEQEHGVDVVRNSFGRKRTEHQITIRTNSTHHKNGNDDIHEISFHVDPDIPEQREQKDVKEKRGVCGDAFDVLVVGEGGVVDKIDVGEHTDERRNDTEPEKIVREKRA
jgi:hypothetical protein